MYTSQPFSKIYVTGQKEYDVTVSYNIYCTYNIIIMKIREVTNEWLFQSNFFALIVILPQLFLFFSVHF